jgi:RNA polymerase sigma-70 factor, ECF subfamily
VIATEGQIALAPPPAGKAAGESALVRAAKRGSADAIEQLVRLHWDAAHRTAFLIVRDAAAAEDICQEAMLAAVTKLGSFDRRRPLAPWLHRIVVNRALDWLRAGKRRAEVLVEAEERAAQEAGEPLSKDLLSALGALSPDDRAIVVLRHLLDYNASEIATMLGLPAATVRTRLRRALDRLRLELGDDWRQT